MIEELSVAKRKKLASLRSVKGRRAEGLFVVEGTRSVLDTLGLFDCEMIVATAQWLDAHRCELPDVAIYQCKATDMERISSLSTAPSVLAVCRIPERRLADPHGKLSVALDGVQDPGNLGTIIRACDWFGVDTIYCSRDTVDVFNPKVVQSTMGALSRVAVHYVDLPDFLARNSDMPLYGTFLDGANLYQSQLSAEGIIVMGNEGNGVSAAVAALLSRRLYIPPFPAVAHSHVESLNVSMATSIVLAEFRRRLI